MALSVIHKELTSMPVDAVVCPTDGRFTGVGGADGAIHRAAGPRLDDDLVRRDGRGGRLVHFLGARACRPAAGGRLVR